MGLQIINRKQVQYSLIIIGLYILNNTQQMKQKCFIKTLIANLVRTARFWNNPHQIRSKSKDWKATQLKVVGATKPKGLNRIARIGYDLICLREENLRLRSPMPERGEP
jgi:hypothetical protein